MFNHNVYWSNTLKLKGKYNDCATLQAKTDLNRPRITVVEIYITIGIDRLCSGTIYSGLAQASITGIAFMNSLPFR